MAGPLAATGAISNPTRYGALNMAGEQFTGLWTQAGPYRDAATAYLQRKFYQGSRFDRILDGINREISSGLTDVRRPGSPIWNNSTWGPVLSYYSFKYIQDGVEVVRVMVDTATAVYDASAGGKTLIMTKSAGAGRTRFLSVGTTLYMSNGVDLMKYSQSNVTWKAFTSYATGQIIVDSNGNRQQALGAQTATIVSVQVVAQLPSGRIVTLFFDPNTADLSLLNNSALTLAGMTTVPTLNGLTPYTVNAQSGTSVVVTGAFPGVPVTAQSVETGTASTGTGITGGSAPIWNGTIGLVTQDGGQQWVNRGPAVRAWALPGPTLAPAVTQALAPSLFPAWAASTWYAPNFTILDSNGNLQLLTTAGTTGGAAPVWNVVTGGTTAEAGPGTAVWTNLGPGAWAASTAYTTTQAVQATFTYYITVYEEVTIGPGVWRGNFYYNPHQESVPVQKAVTVTSFFQCTTAGTSAANPPSWTNGLNTTVADGTVIWTNQGTAPAWPGATQTLSLAAQIVGTNGYTFVPQTMGKSGAAEPTWNTGAGALTADNTQSWLNKGPQTAGSTGAWVWAFSGKDSGTGDVTTASPKSAAVLVAAGNAAVIQGQGMDATFDTIILWRTAQGQSILVYEDEFSNPGPTSTWIYTDTTPDVSGTGGPQLNAFIAAPVSNANDPPPAGMTAPVYYLQRVWAIDENAVVYSGGPDTLVGNGNDAFPPLNRIAFQAKAVRILPITVQGGAMLVFTTSGIKIILGKGTATDPFFAQPFADKINLGGYDALDVMGTQIFLMESNKKISSITIEFPFSPQSGYYEVGFPIGDQFTFCNTGGFNAALFDPALSYVSWNVQGSGETAMYVANGAGQWFRMSAVSPPESGLLWSPIASIVGGSSAVQSVETAPGVFDLLIGPAVSGPILKRDTTGAIYGDNAVGYPSWDAKGVNLLCSTGQWTEVAHISAKSRAVGARPTVSVLLGEIEASLERPWNVLKDFGPDPPNARRSKSVFSDRYMLAQNGVDDTGDCILTRFDYGSQAVADELLDWGIFASTEEERKQEVQKA